MAYRARITLLPRADVLDPQGQAVERALHSLGFDEVGELRVGRYVEMRLDGTDQAEVEARLTAMCDKLIANTVVEDYAFEVAPEDSR